MRFNLKFGPFVAALASSSALAHMQMSYPPILNGKYNSLIPNENKDWNPQNPLEPDGSNFPCRGWIGKDKQNVATFKAGQTMNFSLIGTTPGAYVPHGGGSCQVALSYDSGKTWSTIWSYMGGCVLDKTTYDVVIPPEAPSGEVLFAWDWFNLQGNREMYQNCALVTIAGGGAGLSDKKAFPPPFVANVGNGCATIEGQNVVFPSPGKNVFYGGVYASTRPNTPTGFTGSNCVPAGQQDAGGYNGAPGPAPAPSPSAGAPVPSVNSPAPSPSAGAPNPSVNSPAPSPSAGAPVPSGSSPVPSVNPPAPVPTGINSQVLAAPPSVSTDSTASTSANTVADGSPSSVNSPSPANSPSPSPAKVCRRRKRHVVKKAVSSDNGASGRFESLSFAKGNTLTHNHRGIERRHERLVRRRAAALPAGRPQVL